jgi:hypothetical protein
LRLRFGGLQGSVAKIVGGALPRDIVGRNRFIAPLGEAGVLRLLVRPMAQ